MIYQHPLAYLLGVEGAALQSAFAGGHDREFTEARLAEIRALLDSADQIGEGAWTRPVTAAEGYRARAASYLQALRARLRHVYWIGGGSGAGGPLTRSGRCATCWSATGCSPSSSARKPGVSS